MGFLEYLLREFLTPYQRSLKCRGVRLYIGSTDTNSISYSRAELVYMPHGVRTWRRLAVTCFPHTVVLTKQLEKVAEVFRGSEIRNWELVAQLEYESPALTDELDDLIKQWLEGLPGCMSALERNEFL